MNPPAQSDRDLLHVRRLFAVTLADQMPEEIQHRDLERIAAAREKKHRRLVRWMASAPDVPFIPRKVPLRDRPDHPLYGGRLQAVSDAEAEANRDADENQSG